VRILRVFSGRSLESHGDRSAWDAPSKCGAVQGESIDTNDMCGTLKSEDAILKNHRLYHANVSYGRSFLFIF
jgi:hypothetical protein